MLLRAFPDINWLKKQIASNFSNRQGPNELKFAQSSWPTVVLNVKTSEADRKNIKGPLSLFTNISGRSIVGLENRHVRVDSGTFFVTNREQDYSLNIEESTETFNIHFGDQFVNDLYRSISSNGLDDIDYATDVKLPDYSNQLNRRDAVVNAIILDLYKANQNEESNQLYKDELLIDLFFHILKMEERIKKNVDQLPSVRLSTRQEIFKRIGLAADFMYSRYEEDIKLEELAKMSCLSKFYFIKAFKALYQCTPYQFLLNVRLDKAQEQLRNSELSVSNIAESIGFEHVSSFSRAYYKKHKYYPSLERSPK